MADASYTLREIRLILNDATPGDGEGMGPIDFYAYIEAIGDCPHFVEGWHHKQYGEQVTDAEIMIREAANDGLTWEHRGPPERHEYQVRATVPAPLELDMAPVVHRTVVEARSSAAFLEANGFRDVKIGRLLGEELVDVETGPFAHKSDDLPRWRCRKVVQAVKIRDVDELADTITPEGDGAEPIPVTDTFMTKHQPQAGGYYVRYEDGYESYSPAEAFEGGYTRL